MRLPAYGILIPPMGRNLFLQAVRKAYGLENPCIMVKECTQTDAERSILSSSPPFLELCLLIRGDCPGSIGLSTLAEDRAPAAGRVFSGGAYLRLQWVSPAFHTLSNAGCWSKTGKP